MSEVKAECSACGGTGLYSGMCEGKGLAVMCLQCGGTGCETIQYKPFVKRNGKLGIQYVQRSRGTFVGTGIGPTGSRITYAEFQQGKMPK